jgi:S-adenosyl methyltransferase
MGTVTGRQVGRPPGATSGVTGNVMDSAPRNTGCRLDVPAESGFVRRPGGGCRATLNSARTAGGCRAGGPTLGSRGNPPPRHIGCSSLLAFALFHRSRPRRTLEAPSATSGKLMEPGFAPSQIETGRPHPARMYDYYLGGKDNYLVDREAAAAVLRVLPEARDIARENRAFLQRAVRYLVGEAGIRQIIDIGTGIPTVGNVHEVAQQIDPGVRVAYIDNDPIVHVHASALLTGQGRTSIVLADLRDPRRILDHPKVRELIDLDEPVALLLVAIMHFITEQEGPDQIITTFREALASGSYLALSHGTADFHDRATSEAGAAVYAKATAPLVLRRHAQVTALFDGWDLIEPGVVQVPMWRPDGNLHQSHDLQKIGIYGGVARRTR